MTEKEIIKQITRYIQGELNETEEDQLWVEFLDNPNYYRFFQTELNLYDLYQNKNFRIEENKNRVDEPSKKYGFWSYLAVAAIIIISSALYLFEFRGQNQYASLALSEIELTELLGSDIYRDPETDLTGQNQAINRSISLAFNGDTHQAIEELRNIDEVQLSNPQRIKIRYNLGILLYNAGNLDGAEVSFKDVLELQQPDTPSYITESAQWYIANILLQTNKLPEARSYLSILSESESIHAENAGIILDRVTFIE